MEHCKFIRSVPPICPLTTLLCRSGGDEEGSPKPKATPRKRAGGAAGGSESPNKKAKTPKGKGGKGGKGKAAVGAEEDDEEAGAKTVVKGEETEGDELA